MHLFEDTIFERLLDALRIGDRVLVTSHLFFDFKTNSERAALAYQLLEEENLLPCLEKLPQKSQKVACDLRSEGNKAFQKKNDLAALKFYNRSLAAAPFGSKEFVLAIGNRSAVNFSMGLYKACLNDIDLALQNGYPEELKVKLLERRAKCYIHLCLETEADKAIKQLDLELDKNGKGKKMQQGADSKSIVLDLQSLKDCEKPENILKVSNQTGCLRLPELSYGINPEIQCASSALKLEYSEEKGRYLVATRNIRPGDVLIVEQPYASVLLPDSYATHCYYCLRRCLSPVPCLHCSEAMFCDSVCQTTAWEAFHSIDCSLLPIISKRVGKMGLLALRVLIMASLKGKGLKKLFADIENLDVSSEPRTLGFGKEGQYVSSDYWPMHFLVGHTERRANGDLFRRSVTAACLLHCLEEFSDFFDGDVMDEMFYFCGGLLLQHLQSLPCNAHEVSEMSVNGGSFESQEIGAAGYATLSLLNHSCDPNVVRHSYGDWAVLRAIRPIAEGEEVVDNYGYHHALHSVDFRRSQLYSQYFFHCMCEACQGCWPSYKDQPTVNPVYLCSKCRAPLTKQQDFENQLLCHCGLSIDLVQLELSLTNSSKLFRDTLSAVLAGHHQGEVPESLYQHLVLLDEHIQRPWREFSECQETIKQCLSLQANHLIISL